MFYVGLIQEVQPVHEKDKSESCGNQGVGVSVFGKLRLPVACHEWAIFSGVYFIPGNWFKFYKYIYLGTIYYLH